MAWSQRIKIGARAIGPGNPAFIVAEVGSNHNQNLDQAKALIDAAAKSGADAVKFQSLKLDQVHHLDHVSDDFKQFFRQIELNESWYQELADYSAERGVEFMSSSTYYQAVRLLAEIPVCAIKIASAQFGIHPWLVVQAAQTGIPLIASTGLVAFEEIAGQLRIIEATGNQDLVLLHCVSQYPTPISRVNLRVMKRYRRAFGCLVGYSDHTLSLLVPAVAAAQGACVIEKHITLDRKLPGPDHHFAVEPHEFKQMVSHIREAETSLGSADKASFSKEELNYREAFVYKCISGRALKAGDPLRDLEREARRGDGGIDVRQAPMLYEQFVAGRDIPAGKMLSWSDIQHAG